MRVGRAVAVGPISPWSGAVPLAAGCGARWLERWVPAVGPGGEGTVAAAVGAALPERQRAAAMILAQGAMEKQARQRAHLESFINRFKAQASKARQAQSRMKMLAKMEELAPLHATAPFSFEFRGNKAFLMD